MFPSSDTIGQLAAALAKAQTELVNPPKSLTATLPAGPDGARPTYRYAALSTGLTLVRKALGRNQLAVVQTTQVDPESGAVDLTTALVHGSGEWIAARWPVCEGAARQDPKLMGAALTYARRYSLFALVGVAGEEDRDAADLSPGRSARPALARGPSDGAPRRDRSRRPVRVQPARVIPLRAGPSSATRQERAADLGKAPGSRAAALPDLLRRLDAVTSDAELAQWALAVLPAREALSPAERAALETALKAKATQVAANTSLEEAGSGTPSPALSLSSGDDHAPPPAL